MYSFLRYGTKEKNQMYSFLNYGTNEKSQMYLFLTYGTNEEKINVFIPQLTMI
jgi:hypothetical protein